LQITKAPRAFSRGAGSARNPGQEQFQIRDK
jgi:hypothetical protein